MMRHWRSIVSPCLPTKPIPRTPATAATTCRVCWAKPAIPKPKPTWKMCCSTRWNSEPIIATSAISPSPPRLKPAPCCVLVAARAPTNRNQRAINQRRFTSTRCNKPSKKATFWTCCTTIWPTASPTNCRFRGKNTVKPRSKKTAPGNRCWNGCKFIPSILAAPFRSSLNIFAPMSKEC